MEVVICNDKISWNTWAQENGASFLQSWEWGEILEAEGKRVERLQVVEGNEVVVQAAVVYNALPFGMQYAFCAKGPTVNLRLKNLDFRIHQLLADNLKNKQCIFFRIEPMSLVHKSEILIHKSVDINPRATTVVDIRKTEEQLLETMHPKTRYNIRLADKKNLRLVEGKDLEMFLKLSEETASRDNFRLHDAAHYKAIFNAPFSRQLSVMTSEGAVAATAVFVGFGSTFTYLFGASHYASRALMAPPWLQWQAILLGKKLGYSQYDLFGIAPRTHLQKDNGEYEYDKDHQYGGVTRFKLGFGGKVTENPGTFDLLISPSKYRIYRLLRALRRLI